MKTEIIMPRMSKEEVEDYRSRLGSYLYSMCFFKKMLDDGDINEDEYSEIEKMLLAKYRVSEKSLQRMDLISIAQRIR